MSYYNETTANGSWGAGGKCDPWRIRRLKEEEKERKMAADAAALGTDESIDGSEVRDVWNERRVPEK